MLTLLFFLLTFLIYAYVNHNGEFTATASAIRQIWSGSCRLSCRQSQYSGFSGLSGLPTEGTSAVDPGTSQRFVDRRPNFCVCETCPCALIDNMLSSCRPVTSLYEGALEFVSAYLCYAIQMVNDSLEYFTRVTNCRVTSQRQAQFTGPKQLDSSQNIYFDNPSRKTRSESKMQAVKSIILRRKSTFAAERTETTDSKNDAYKDGTLASISNMSNNVIESETIREVDESEEKGCSKCIEKGFTCMKNCPRAKKS